MAKIAEAYVEISARLDKMEAGLKDAQSKLGKATTQMQAQANTLTGSIAKVKAAYAAASVFIGGAFVSAITGAIKSTADHLDQLDEMSSKTGVSVEMLTSLELAAKQSSISMEQLAVSIRMMYRSMNEAAGGGKEAAETYKRLGVNVRDSAGNLKSGNEAFLEVADAISKIQNPAEKSAMAMKVFGRAGTEMLPMLEGGKAALKAYIDEAKRLGLVFTEDQAKTAAAFNDQLDALTSRLTAFKEKSLLPVIEALTMLMGGKSNRSESKATATFGDIAKYVGDIFAGFAKGQSAVEAVATAAAKLRINTEAAAIAAGKYDEVFYGQYLNKPTYSADVIANKNGGGGTPKPSARKYGVTTPGTYNTLGIRGVPQGSRELIGQFAEVQDTVIDTFTNIGAAMADIEQQWGNTISGFIKGGQTFSEFMSGMFEDVLDGFSQMIGQMAAKWLSQSIFNGITSSWLGGGNHTAQTAGRAAATTININAVDAASFEALARRNAGAITSVVWEAQTFGRSI